MYIDTRFLYSDISLELGGEEMDLRSKLKGFVIGLFFVVVNVSNGFSEEAVDFKRVVSVNPVGLVYGIANVGYEWVITPDFAGVGNLLYTSAKFGDWQWSAFGIGGGIKKYAKPTAPEGFWYGGQGGVLIFSAKYKYTTVEWEDLRYTYREETEEGSSTFFALAGLGGYKWIFGEGFVIEPQGGLALIMGRLELLGENIPISTIGACFGVNIGYAF